MASTPRTPRTPIPPAPLPDEVEPDDAPFAATAPVPAPLPAPVDLDSESVAGEEDPGAGADLTARAVAIPVGQGVPQGAVQRGGQGGTTGAPGPMAPGDQAPAGTPGTGEDVCPRCGGVGRIPGGGVAGGVPCPECEGTGKVVVGIGGG